MIFLKDFLTLLQQAWNDSWLGMVYVLFLAGCFLFLLAAAAYLLYRFIHLEKRKRRIRNRHLRFNERDIYHS
jgi:uncharacterized membrane protein